MADDTRSLPHLRLVTRAQGKARLFGGGEASERTQKNKAERAQHSAALMHSVQHGAAGWKEQQSGRAEQGLPSLSSGVPLLLQIDPGLDLDQLRSSLAFEIVSEQPDGFVIVASEDADLNKLLKRINEFASNIRGSTVIASVYEIYTGSSIERLRTLSEWLYEIWPKIDEGQDYIVDVGVECAGMQEIPTEPTITARKDDESDAKWAKREAAHLVKRAEWAEKKSAVYMAWDDLKSKREQEIAGIVETSYRGEILGIQDRKVVDAVQDSFTARIRISGKGLKDFVQNYPYIFEVVEPDDVELPQRLVEQAEKEVAQIELEPPSPEAPAIGVIDSGIQEAHPWLSRAIDQASSISFLPSDASVADLVRPGGHGTRVAGAVLFGGDVPRTGRHQLPFWLQNVRVLDGNCKMPKELFPALATRAAILHLRGGVKHTRLFNHSINSSAPCRLAHMSAWAAEIDGLAYEHDILVIQSCGNLASSAPTTKSGVEDHLRAKRIYPDYLDEPSCRIANPGQSLQALTIGSVAYGLYESHGWRSFASEVGHPSAFSRSGPGIWDAIKPEVVEFGGDFLRTSGESSGVATPAMGKVCYPELIRSTLYGVGPAIDRDTVGTSFATPKVTHIAAHLQAALPAEPTLLYRALIVQSARWPAWARELLQEHQSERERNQKLRAKARTRAKKQGAPSPAAETLQVDTVREEALATQASAVMRRLGFGIPNLDRATSNNEYRTTLITSGVQPLKVGACDVFQVPIPPAVRASGNDFDVLVEVTLSYAAQPRRTRRTAKRYLSVWLDWMTNSLGETRDAFQKRALTQGTSALAEAVESENEEAQSSNPGARRRGVPWTLGVQDAHGGVRGISRGSGTVQKDWAVVKLHQLPEDFCIAVRAHKGWSKDPEATARYVLVVSFEVLGQEVSIYEEVRVALDELQVEIGDGR